MKNNWGFSDKLPSEIVDEFLVRVSEMKKTKKTFLPKFSFDKSLILLGARIRVVYKSMGLSQGEFAGKIGVKQYELSRWVTGKYPPSALDIKKISDVTGKPLDYFFEGI